jgi:hypothetical protein
MGIEDDVKKLIMSVDGIRDRQERLKDAFANDIIKLSKRLDCLEGKEKKSEPEAPRRPTMHELYDLYYEVETGSDFTDMGQVVVKHIQSVVDRFMSKCHYMSDSQRVNYFMELFADDKRYYKGESDE